MVVQALGELPAELRLTPERDARLVDQASRIGRGEVARLLDLLAAALEAGKQRGRPAHAARARAREGRVAGGRPVGEGAAGPRRARSRARAGGRSAAAAPHRRPAAAGAPVRRPAATARRPREPAAARGAAGSAAARRPTAAAAEAGPRRSTARRSPLWPAVLDHASRRRTCVLRERRCAESRPVELRGGELDRRVPARLGVPAPQGRDTETYRACVVEALKAVTGAGAAPRLRAARLRWRRPRDGADGPGEPPLTEEELVARFVTEFDAEEIVPEPEPEETA